MSAYYSIIIPIVTIVISIFFIVSLAGCRSRWDKGYEALTWEKLLYAAFCFLLMASVWSVSSIFAIPIKSELHCISLMLNSIADTVLVMDYIYDRKKRKKKEKL